MTDTTNLENCIALGYEFIEAIEKEYREIPREKLGDLLTKFYRIEKEWMDQSKENIPSNARKKSFELARSRDALYESGKSIDVQNLIKDFRAKINKLEEFIEQNTDKTTLVFSGDQSRAYFNSVDNSINTVNNHQFMAMIEKLEQEFESKYNKEDKAESIKIIEELKTKAESNDISGSKKLLGILLTRGAEIAQISSLIIQIITALPH